LSVRTAALGVCGNFGGDVGMRGRKSKIPFFGFWWLNFPFSEIFEILSLFEIFKIFGGCFVEDINDFHFKKNFFPKHHPYHVQVCCVDWHRRTHDDGHYTLHQNVRINRHTPLCSSIAKK